LRDKGGVFDFAKPVTALDPEYYINHRDIGALTDPLDDLLASLNDLDAWRRANGRGGDIRILSDLKAVRLTNPDTFILP
jgi:hypothetical protein